MSEKTIHSILSTMRDAKAIEDSVKKLNECGITYASLMQLMREHKDKARVRTKLMQVAGLLVGARVKIANAVSEDFQEELKE